MIRLTPTVSKYHYSFLKQILDFSVSFIIFLVTLPFVLFIAVVSAVTSGLPVFFIQKRAGINGRPFKIIKFRTMINGAEKMQKKYKKLNESDGPAFKIKNDPRFTGFGKILSNTGLDELPQFINVLKGEMSIVGPRPLPIAEAKKLSGVYRVRALVKPGITSSWVTGGSHKLSFRKWMDLDREYVTKGKFGDDLEIMFKTTALIFRFLSHLI
jgi:lipopolysaccharide/colanic/teichoic acid biosynthesis glycosyltransferase